MNNPFTWFLVLVFGGLISFAYLARRVLRELTEQAAIHAKLYSAAYAKGGALIVIAMMSSFVENFEKLSSDVATLLPWWMWVAMFVKCVIPGLTTYVAFVDRTMERAREERTVQDAANSK